jgi:hypothetical protein
MMDINTFKTIGYNISYGILLFYFINIIYQILGVCFSYYCISWMYVITGPPLLCLAINYCQNFIIVNTISIVGVLYGSKMLIDWKLR